MSAHKLLLSFRAAAALLGIGRNDALHELIRRGALRPVTVLDRTYIPREQVEALARTGERPPTSTTRKPRRVITASIADVEV